MRRPGGGPVRRQEQRPERDGEPREDHLGLGIAEPGVALEEHRSIGGEHEARVEEAPEGRAAPGHLREDRAVDGLEHPLDRRRRRGPAAASTPPSRRCSGRGPRRTGACGRGRRAGRWRASRRRWRSRWPRGRRAAPRSRAPDTSAGRPTRKPGSRSRACSADSVTITPLPPARPSALRTAPAPSAASSRTKASAAAARLGAGERACARPSGRRPRRSPPRGSTPWRSRGAPPPAMARRRGSGPRRARRRPRPRAGPPARSRPARPQRRCAPPQTTAAGSRGSTPARRRTRGSAAIAALPGATSTSFRPGSAASFQARACSRPPLPTIRTRVGVTSVTGPSPRARASRPGDPAAVAHRTPCPLDRLRSLRADGHEDDRDAARAPRAP